MPKTNDFVFNVAEIVSPESLAEACPQLVPCLDIWNEIKGDRDAPSFVDDVLSKLPTKLIPYATIVDVLSPPGTPITSDKLVYRFWGTGHVRARNIERTGQSVSEHPESYAGTVTDEYRQVIESRHPIAFKKYINLDKPFNAVELFALRLPLASDGENVDKVLSVIHWTPIGE